MSNKSGKRKIFYAYTGLILFLVLVTVFLVTRINYFDSLYAFHTTYMNVSSLCSSGKPSMVLFYGPNTTSVNTELGAFVNTTSLFGVWSSNQFYSGYFCAWKVNISAFNQNASSLAAPANVIPLFNQLSQNRVPLVVFNGEYYKIGGFTNSTQANYDMLKYICLSINDSAPQCA